MTFSSLPASTGSTGTHPSLGAGVSELLKVSHIELPMREPSRSMNHALRLVVRCAEVESAAQNLPRQVHELWPDRNQTVNTYTGKEIHIRTVVSATARTTIRKYPLKTCASSGKNTGKVFR